MKKINLSYALSRSMTGISRATMMSMATLLLLTCFLLVLGSYGLLHFNVVENIAGLSAQGQAAAFLNSDCTEEDTAKIRKLLDEQCSAGIIKEYRYVSATDALRSELDKFTEYPQLYQSFQTGENPYRASFVVTAKSEDTFDSMLSVLQELTITRVNESGETVFYAPIAAVVSHQAVVEQVEMILANIRNGVLLFLLVLLLVLLFVLINTIRLAIFNQRKELSVMRYLGATHGFLVAPFLLQGVVLGFLSACITFFMQWFLYHRLSTYFAEHYRMISLLPFDQLWYYLLAAFLFVGLFIGFMGSLLSTSRYLRDRD